MEKFEFASLDRPFEADWPVVVQVPGDGGIVTPQTFMARLRLLSLEEIEATLEAPDFSARSLPRQFFVGFGREEIFDGDFEAVRERLLEVAWTRDGLNGAYKQFAAGEASLGNSAPPAS